MKVALIVCVLFCGIIRGVTAAPSTRPGDPFVMSPGQYWLNDWATGPRVPMAGDIDGDGRADLISLYSDGDCVLDFAPTSALGKPILGAPPRRNFGRNAIAAVCGPFTKTGVADLAAVFADGTVRVASRKSPVAGVYDQDKQAATLSPDVLPKGPLRAVTADFDGDGRPDILLCGTDGRLLFLQNTTGSDGTAHFMPKPVTGLLPHATQIGAGNVSTDPHARLFWLTDSGIAWRAVLRFSQDGSIQLSPAVKFFASAPGARLVVGHFQGRPLADVIVGQRLFPGGDPTQAFVVPTLPTVDEARSDARWIVADIDGNGQDDLIRQRHSSDRFDGHDIVIHYCAHAHDPVKGYISTTQDGLLDDWKTGRVKPGGLDLAALGCSPNHRDVIVEVERADDVDLNALKSNMDKVVQYYASLPLHNPDGKDGIALHVIYRDSTHIRDHAAFLAHFDETYPPKEQRGIVHTMFCENNGPLVAKLNSDNGHFNGGWAAFLHEFGHQVALDHAGFWPVEHCALYPSLMNYSYSYSRNDRKEEAAYSDGSLASVTLHEPHLSEVLPFPFEKVKFLSGGPYRFHIKPGPDGRTTLVDWNWNGIFGEPDVAADINYSHGTSFGPASDVGHSFTAPVLTTQGAGQNARLLLLSGQLPAGTNATEGNLSPQQPGRLTLRVWQGKNTDTEGAKWPDEVTVEAQGVTGDPTAASLGDTVWVTYPTAQGTVLRRIVADAAGTEQVGPPIAVPDSLGASPTLTALGGQLALLLWRSPVRPVGLRLVTVSGENLTLGPEVAGDFVSTVPVGAIAGAADGSGQSLWVGRLEGNDPERQGWTQARRYTLGADGTLRLADQQWIEGLYSTHRMTMLWEPERGMEPQGRLYQFTGGVTRPDKPQAEQYICMQTAYKDVDRGWQYRRYLEPEFTSRSAPGACWFRGSIAYAVRVFSADPARNNTVQIGFDGNGVLPDPMGDFDDISHIRDVGLKQSIRWVTH